LTWSPQQPPATVWDVSSELIDESVKSKLQSDEKLNTTNQFGNVIRGYEHILVIQKISQPTEIADGKWKVEMFANQLVFNGYDRLGESIHVNKQIFIQAIDEPVASLSSKSIPLQLAAYKLAEAKLKIYKICELEDEKCAENPN
ncbi:MAG: hypothetical protein RMX68_016785, partial [Aulosira sp. ZfuVER01]|nr:hypothetical protein [Aulosira sp. ZfuVER01]MDZ8054253.1 hypothetical protein [Aulosira sp. ZfuCHP01]